MRGRELGALPEPRERRLDHQLVEVVEHATSRPVLAAPPRRDGRQLQVLAEQVAAQAREKRHERRRFHEAAAEAVGDEHLAGPRRLHEAWHAQQRIAAQFQRIAEVVVHAADDHVDRVQPRQRLQEDAAVAHGEIVAADERQPQCRARNECSK